MVVTHVVLELVTAGELLLADGAPEGGPGHPVQGGAELAPALARVDHVLDLQQAGGHLAIAMISVSGVWTSHNITQSVILPELHLIITGNRKIRVSKIVPILFECWQATFIP